MANKFWKIWAWFYLTTQIVGLYYGFKYQLFKFDISLIIIDIVSTIFIIELFLFVYKKYILSQLFWKIFFFVGIIIAYWYMLLILWEIMWHIQIINKIIGSSPTETWVTLFIGTIIRLPLYIASYLYAFRDWNKKKIEEQNINP